MGTAANQCICGGPTLTVLDKTGDRVRCDGFIKGKELIIDPVLPIVPKAICVIQEDRNHFVLILNQTCQYSDDEQKEIFCLPYQAEQHGVKFDLTLKHRLNVSDENGKQKLIIDDRDVPLEFNGLKMYLKI